MALVSCTGGWPISLRAPAPPALACDLASAACPPAAPTLRGRQPVVAGHKAEQLGGPASVHAVLRCAVQPGQGSVSRGITLELGSAGLRRTGRLRARRCAWELGA